jgi:hypothetical protein
MYRQVLQEIYFIYEPHTCVPGAQCDQNVYRKQQKNREKLFHVNFLEDLTEVNDN